MASFARGLGLGLSLLAPRAAPLCATPQPLQPFSRRFFGSIAALRHAAKPPSPSSPRIAASLPRAATAPKTLTPKPKPTAPGPTRTVSPAAAVSSAGSAYALTAQLAQRSQPTVLYEAGSHFWMKLSAWAAMLMFYSYAGINYYTMLLHPPEDIAAWVPHAFAVICLAMAGFGSYFFYNTRNIVRLVRAVPTALLAPNARGLASGAAAVALNPKTTPIHLEITCKRMLPGRAKVLVVPPQQVSMPGRIIAQTASSHASPAQERAAARREQARARAEWEYDKDHLMTVPFRHAGKGFRAAWYGIRRAVTREGFMQMEVGGQKLKLDVASGWALDDGRAIDRLVKIGA
ncbi:uncharacterized protein LY79DRAFT_655827 [Colletotrichum navitas]|uniref:Uncharacterized protein n=1 Tax=Colletotrichum navitas TaxID=681940 RepID=A0AAD8V8X6_9PEZI|nr:uncharacterized protein LY79DRAFT_655827 [Colletotrichum navitas]KAK1598682.1 hypothetical protein LY79DRAFT_655827 [Colletotrichum navitas]